MGVKSRKSFKMIALLLVLILILATSNIRIAKAKQLTVVISNGHAVGYDPGTTASELVTEAELNERVAIATMKELDKRGYKVYLTYTSDPNYQDRALSDCKTCDTLRNVGPIVNSVNPDLVYCIHHNSLVTVPTTVSGMELYWSSYRDYDENGVYTDPILWDNTGGYKDVSPCKDAQESLRLANIMFKTFQGFPNMSTPRSINERNDYLPAHAKAPCVLYEGGYLSTPSEAVFMNTDEYRDEAAKRLADSVDLYFDNTSTTTGTKTTPDEIKMVTGGEVQLDSVSIPEDSNKYNYLYMSNDPSVASVNLVTGLVTGLKPGKTEIVVKPNSNQSLEEKIPVTVFQAPNIAVEYKAYTKNGWQKVSNGALVGSTNSDLPIYGIKAHLKDENGNTINPNILNLSYRTHIANVGWSNYTATGQISGAKNTQNPIEAIEFSLNGENVNQYKIFYRSFLKDHDWTPFVSSNSNCGSEGLSLPISGFELLVLPDTATAPTVGIGFYSKYGNGDLRYATHISNIGWTNYTSDGLESGKPDSGESIEAIDFKVSNNIPKGSITSETHISNIGWVLSDSQTIGTTGQALPIEAIKLSLSGDLETLYNINYQVYVKGEGWQEPVSNGALAGTTSQSLPIESVKIWLTKK